MPINSQLEADEEIIDQIQEPQVKRKLADGWTKVQLSEDLVVYRHNKTKTFTLTPVMA